MLHVCDHLLQFLWLWLISSTTCMRAACRPQLSEHSTYCLPLFAKVNTSMLRVDICHLKQTALIRSSTKCKYQSGQPRRTSGKTHYTRQTRGFLHFISSQKTCICVLPETRQLQEKTKLEAPVSPRCGLEARDSSDGCESAATDVHTQFLGVNLSLHKNCVWTISR